MEGWRIVAIMPLMLLGGWLSFAADEGSGTTATPTKVADSADKARPLGVGAKTPDVTVQTVEGKTLKLREIVAKKPTALIFYRGGWCPYCSTHLKGLQKIETKLDGLGYQLLAVSPDRPEKLRETAGKDKLKYRLLSDTKLEAAKAFGLAFQLDDITLDKYKTYGIDLVAASGETHQQLPVPAVYLIGTDGVIDYAHADPDYRKRLDPEIVIKEAEKAIQN